MTTYVPFAPSATVNFQFQATLDGQLYNCVVVWNFFRGGSAPGWYLTIYDLSGNLIVATPLTGSPSGNALASLVWQPFGAVSSGNSTGSVLAALGSGLLTLPIGAVVMLNIAGCLPAGYNYSGPCAVLGPQSFSYPVATNPGPLATLGQASFDINLISGFFESSLVFRNNQFEISP